MTYKLLIPVLLFIGILKTQSQIDPQALEFNTVEQNIFQRPITSLVLDKFGFLWIGTEGEGLYKYNGYSYTYYRHDANDIKSINSNSISSIFLDDSKQLWIGTDAGLSKYNEEQNSFERVTTDKQTQTDFNYLSVTCFAKHKEQFLVGTYDGIKQLNLQTGLLQDYGHPGVSIMDLQFSAKGDLFIATNEGLKVEWNNQKGQVEKLFLQNENQIEHITSLHIDQRQNLWVGTLKSGTFRRDLRNVNSTFSKLDIIESTTMDIVSDINHVFISVENEGLFILNGNGEIENYYKYIIQDNHGIGSDSIWSLLIDPQNRLWLGYYENGLGFFDKYYNKFKSIQREKDKSSIYSNDVKAFAKTNDSKIWIAQVNGIDIYDTKNKKFTNVYGSSESNFKGLKKGLYIEDIFIDSKENVWIATWGEGIFLLKKGSNNFLNFNKSNTEGILQTNKFRCFTEDKNGKIWIGSFLEGVYYYDINTDKIQAPTSESYLNSEVIHKDIKVLFHDSFGYTWVGSSSGLYAIENDDNHNHIVTSYNSIISSEFEGHPSYNRILDIYETQDGTLWFGTNGGGILTFKREQIKFEQLHLEGYDLSLVNAIYEPIENELWLSSKQGVLKIDRHTNEVFQFTVHDGLLENFLNDRAVLMDNNSILYLGTKSGVNIIEPTTIVYNPYLAKPYLKNVRLFNQKVNPSDKKSPLIIENGKNIISLKHDQTVLTIDYESVSYTRPKKNKYAYFLEGFDKNWNFVGSKTNATYTNLEPGEYFFKLKASNNDNVWNKPSTILNINVLPPWWKTIWAYILYILALSLLIFGTMYLYRRRINEINRFKFERERRKQKAELQQQKLQFFTNISHEFRTPLTLIVNPIKELIEFKNANFPESVQQKHHIIYKNAERLSRLINELMDFRKLQSDKLILQISHFGIVSKIKNILSFFNEESTRRAIQLDLKYEDINLKIWADSGILDKVMFNLLSNAFKVTPNKGRIKVTIASTKKRILPHIHKKTPVPVIEINVKDNGPGIDQKEYKRIFDRFYQIGELNKSYYGSSGIGLEMVKSFIRLHNGIIEVESEPGKGSNFKIIIPNGKTYFAGRNVSFVDEDDKTTYINEDRKTKIETYKIEHMLSKKDVKKKVLIAEDNTDLQDYLVSILEQDYELVLASDGQEGWLKTLEYRPDLILTDLIMPVMDGIDFCEKIKNDPNLIQTPVIILSAKSFTEDRIKAMEIGAEAYLIKPFDSKELKVTIRQLLLKKERFSKQNSNDLSAHEEEIDMSLDNDFIQKVLKFINDNIENSSLNVETLSSHLCLSRSQVYRKIKTLTGLSPIEFIRRIRLERSKTIFKNDNNLNVSEVAHKVGFLSASYFTVCYKKQFGELPKGRKIK